MNALVEYDAALKLLSSALDSKDLTFVSKTRLDFELLKARAKQIRNKQLLADATEFQMRIERWLGQLLIDAKEIGQLRRHGCRGGRKVDLSKPPTLAEINIDKSLAAKAQRAAVLQSTAFERVISEARERVLAGRSKTVRHCDRSTDIASPFDFALSDGTLLGNVHLGKLRSRIALLKVETRILETIFQRVGSTLDGLTSVRSAVSEKEVTKIIEAASSACSS